MPNGLDAPTLRDLRWLLGFLSVASTIAYGVIVATEPRIRQPLTLAAFTILLAVHLTLHWLLLRLSARSRWIIAYTIVQGILFLAVALIAHTPSMVFTLSASLVGEAVGSLGLGRRGLLAASYYVLLVAVSFVAIFGWHGALWWIVGTVAIAVTSAFYTLLFKRQAQARQQAQALLQDLEAANRQLTEYAARVEDLTTAAERQRMARELHDTLSQGLAGLVLQLEAVAAHLRASRPERALTIAEEAMETARGTLAESRRAIADLRQGAPRDLGEAARQEAEHFSSSTGIPCAVEIALPVAPAEAVTEAASRVLAEGLTNIARHARAHDVRLRIATISEAEELELEICDDGIGFEPASVEAGHFGLLGMRERVELAGGRLEVRSAPGKGTQLVIRFPLQNGAPAAALGEAPRRNDGGDAAGSQ
jgi:NarL family two-component system sensor histidine kinase YdfH